jgi:integrase
MERAGSGCGEAAAEVDYLSHSEAVEYVSRVAGMSRETFDASIRPRLLERKYSERVSRFARVAIERAIDDPAYSELEGQAMLFGKKKTVKDALEHTWELEWAGQKGSKTQRNLVDQIIGELGDEPLKKLDYNRLEAWVLALKKRKLAPATIARRMTTLMKALSIAKAKGWIDKLPERPKVSIGDNERDRYLTKDEEIRLFSVKLRGKWGGTILPHTMRFLLDTGCRLSELMKVRPHEVLDDEIIFSDRKAGGKIKVPLTVAARVAVMELLADPTWQHWTADVHDRDEDRRKTALKNLKDKLTREFRRIRTAAKVPDDVTLHVFRHTRASRLLQAGYDIVKVQNWLGHRDIKTTMRYAHLSRSSLHDGRALVEAESREADDKVVDFSSLRIPRD